MLEKLPDIGGTNAPHSAELIESLFGAFGGMRGYSRWLFATFLAAPAGSAIRERLLSRVMDIAERVSSAGDANERFDMLSDEDVRKVLIKALEEKAKNTVDAK